MRGFFYVWVFYTLSLRETTAWTQEVELRLEPSPRDGEREV